MAMIKQRGEAENGLVHAQATTGGWSTWARWCATQRLQSQQTTLRDRRPSSTSSRRARICSASSVPE
eukprot:8008510-Pyramimonas_sp.AAC.1